MVELYVPVNNTSVFVKIPNSFRYLKYDVSSKIFTEVRQLDDLVEQFASFHHW